MDSALTDLRRPDLPVYVADLVGLAVAAERADNPSARTLSHRLDAFRISHERLERGDERLDIVKRRENAVVPALNDLCRCAGAGCHKTVAARHSLEHGEPEPLDSRGKNVNGDPLIP